MHTLRVGEMLATGLLKPWFLGRCHLLVVRGLVERREEVFRRPVVIETLGYVVAVGLFTGLFLVGGIIPESMDVKQFITHRVESYLFLLHSLHYFLVVSPPFVVVRGDFSRQIKLVHRGLVPIASKIFLHWASGRIILAGPSI